MLRTYTKAKDNEIIKYDFSELYDFFKKIKSDSKLKPAELEILNFCYTELNT